MIPGLGQGRIHLLGICGTGMASLAGMLKEKGFTVSGSDQNTYPPMSEMLCELGIDVRSPYGAKNVPSQTDLVVVGNAISRGNPELEEVLDRRLPYVS
ncbi:MAG: Mur ligase domain-containing protein, partial [Acidobacteriota bacterium]